MIFDLLTGIKVEQGYKDARRNDTRSLKTRILTFIPNNYQQQELDDNAFSPFLDPTTKSGRGLAHSMIIPLLAPIELVKPFINKKSDDPTRLKYSVRYFVVILLTTHHRLIRDAKANKIVLKPDEFPAFLYDLSRFFLDKERSGRAGIYRGYLIARVSCYVLTLAFVELFLGLLRNPHVA